MKNKYRIYGTDKRVVLITERMTFKSNVISSEDMKKIINENKGKVILYNKIDSLFRTKNSSRKGVLLEYLESDEDKAHTFIATEIVDILNDNFNEGDLVENKIFKLKDYDKEKIKKLKNTLLKSLTLLNMENGDGEEETIAIKSYLKGLTDTEFIHGFASFVGLPSNKRLEIYYKDSLEDVYSYVVKIFGNNFAKKIERQKIDTDDLDAKVRNKVGKQQREYILREKIKVAQEELDKITGEGNEFDSLKKKINENPYPKHIKEKLLKEVSRLEQIPSQAQESNIIRQYVETLMELPYWQSDEEKIDINFAKKKLDSDHYGLEKPKAKIIEYLAVKQQNPEAKGSILALVGPPGTGKTTLAKSIADSLGRKLIKIALGGVKDEAEIRGHRRTYIAAQPGKLIQGMKKAGVINPVILLDEIDKMSSDFKGDPTSAMLEVLDYGQNNMFQDHYIEEEYDLSNVTFIATANYYQDIPEALYDRLDIIDIGSYTELEKIQIFKKHLLKRIILETKIPKNLFKWNDNSIKFLIRHFTIEAGVRQLYREGLTVARKILVKMLNNEIKEKSITISPDFIVELLGPQKFDYTKIDSKPQVGTVTGLAWTSYGGDILPIEVSLHKGKGELILTGQLKDVMKESATIALSYIKSNYKDFNISEKKIKELEDLNIHVHSPDGATPKDGPSAGVTFTTALLSAITGKPVSQFLGMTGEISLRGHVLPIGGLKEKSISAFRSGLKKIFIPNENVKDTIDIPDNVKRKIEIIPVKEYSEIYKEIFK